MVRWGLGVVTVDVGYRRVLGMSATCCGISEIGEGDLQKRMTRKMDAAERWNSMLCVMYQGLIRGLR